MSTQVAGRPKVDPITREVVQNRLVSIVREMSHSLARASYSPIIYEVKDFSNVLLRPNSELVAQAEGIPVFLGAMAPVLDAVLAHYPVEDLRPGDVFVSNDPYAGNGTHKNDVNVVRPIFDGDEPVLFAVCKAHWTDIGGKDPGSWSPDARNIFQEGVNDPAAAARGGRTDEPRASGDDPLEHARAREQRGRSTRAARRMSRRRAARA